MNDTQNHNQSDELLSAAALRILDNAECVQVFAHIEASAEQARLLDQYRHTVAMLALTLPSQPMPPARSAQLRARLLGRARNAAGHSPGSQPANAAVSSSRSLSVTSRWAGWTVAAGLAGLLLVHHGLHRPLAYAWVVGGVLALILVALGIYARILRARVFALQDHLRGPERRDGWTNESVRENA